MTNDCHLEVFCYWQDFMAVGIRLEYITRVRLVTSAMGGLANEASTFYTCMQLRQLIKL